MLLRSDNSTMIWKGMHAVEISDKGPLGKEDSDCHKVNTNKITSMRSWKRSVLTWGQHVGVDMSCLHVLAECTGCVTQTTGRVAA